MIALTALLFFSAPALEPVEVRSYQSISGDRTVKLEMLRLKDTQRVLMRFSGSAHRLDGQTWMYLVKNKGQGRVDYQLEGTQSVLLTSRGNKTLLKGTLTETSRLWTNRHGINVVLLAAGDATGSKLLAEYQRAQGAAELSPAAAEAGVAQGSKALRRTCGFSGLKLKFEETTRDNVGLVMKLVVAAAALQEVCADDDYKEAVGALESVVFSQGTKPGLQIISNGSTRTLVVSPNCNNVALQAKRAWENAL